MAWDFPRHRITNGDSADPDDLNMYVELLWGQAQFLNEHNFATDAFVFGSDIEAQAVLRTDQVWEEVNPGIYSDPPSLVPAPSDVSMVASGDVLQSIADYGWRTIISRTVTVDTCSIWIMFSFQQGISVPGVGGPNWPGVCSRGGVQYVIAIDGSPIVETITGSGERSLDVNGEGYGGTGANEAMVIDAIIPVLAGPHTISILWKQCRQKDYEQPDTDDYFMVLSRELIIVELY